MRITRLALAVVAPILTAAALTGCGESQPEVTKEALTKPADTSQFQASGMLDQMKANVKADKSGRPLTK